MEVSNIRLGIFNKMKTRCAKLLGVISLGMVIILSSALFDSQSAGAQIYDNTIRPKLDWFELKTPHFRIIYHEGYEETARRAGRLLESEYAEIQKLVGGKLNNFPVIINGYNDLSNGYVTSLNFRIEVEAPPLAGKILNPRTGGHLENLMAHELVHALQLSEHGGFGLSRFLYIFSPDVARSMHGFMLPGMIEGFAVYHESNLNTHGGRGNYAPFTQRFNDNARTSQPWTLGQNLTPSGISHPTDRFYIGGHHFVDWIEENHGKEAIRKSIRGFAKFPLIGYTPYLWYQTGSSPSGLYRNFRTDIMRKEAVRRDSIYSEGLTIPIIPHFGNNVGPDIHTPQWINNNEIIFYGRFYNNLSGFYSYNVSSRETRLIHPTGLEISRKYSIDRDRSKILYSRYRAHLLHDNRYTTDVFELNFESGSVNQITHDARIIAPSYAFDGNFLALQNNRETMRLVKHGKSERTGRDTIRVLSSIFPDNIVEVAVNPSQPMLSAIIANKNGVQGIWFAHETFIRDILVQDPDIAFKNGSLYDVSWSADGLALYFTGERNAVMNVYKYDYVEDQVFQLTNTFYNAMEASLSPDGERLAMVVYENNLRRLAIIETKELREKLIPESEWRPSLIADGGSLIPRQRLGDELLEVSKFWQSEPFTTDLSWLRPRMWYPISSEMVTPKTYSLGVEVSSADILRRNAYTLGVEYGDDRLFYDFSYRYSGVFPMIELRTRYLPFRPGGFESNDDFHFIGEQWISSVGFPMYFNLDHESYTNFIYVRPEIQHLSEKSSLTNLQGTGTTNYIENGPFRTGRFSTFAYAGFQLRQTMRAHQPTSGYAIFAQIDADFLYDTTIDPFRAFRVGSDLYMSPAKHLNHSFKFGVEHVKQIRPGYNTIGLIHEAFNNTNLTGFGKDFSLLKMRYTLPLSYRDRGGFLFPFFLESSYITYFTETVVPAGGFENSLTAAGIGIRARFRFFGGIPIDLGIGYAAILDFNTSDILIDETIVVNF